MVGIRNYLGKKFKSLSVTALNDIKDMTTLLQQVMPDLINSWTRAEISGRSYKYFTLVNYDSRVIITSKLLVFTT